MQDDDGKINVAELGTTLAALQQQIDTLQAQNLELKRQQDRRDGVQLHDDILALFPAHIQREPMASTERKRMLAKYAKCDQLPVSLKDDNGLASKAMGDGTSKKWVISHMQTTQKEALDLLRVGALGLQGALGIPDDAARAAHLLVVLRDVVSLSCDNAQRLARTQIEHVFEAAQAKGAYTLMDFAQDSEDIDDKDTNIIQQAHIDAMQDIRKFNASVKNNNNNNNNKGTRSGKGGGRGNTFNPRRFGGRGGSWRGSGSRGGGSWRSGGGSYPNGGKGGGTGSGAPTPQ